MGKKHQLSVPGAGDLLSSYIYRSPPKRKLLTILCSSGGKRFVEAQYKTYISTGLLVMDFGLLLDLADTSISPHWVALQLLLSSLINH